MSQTVLLPSSPGASLPRSPIQKSPPDCTPQQLQQLIAQAELESGRAVPVQASQEDIHLAPVVFFLLTIIFSSALISIAACTIGKSPSTI